MWPFWLYIYIPISNRSAHNELEKNRWVKNHRGGHLYACLGYKHIMQTGEDCTKEGKIKTMKYCESYFLRCYLCITSWLWGWRMEKKTNNTPIVVNRLWQFISTVGCFEMELQTVCISKSYAKYVGHAFSTWLAPEFYKSAWYHHGIIKKDLFINNSDISWVVCDRRVRFARQI